MIHKSRPIFSTQFHPEAKGGPLDSAYLFDAYLESVNKYKRSQSNFQPHRESKPSPLLVDLLAKERVGVKPDWAARGHGRKSEAEAAAAEVAAVAA